MSFKTMYALLLLAVLCEPSSGMRAPAWGPVAEGHISSNSLGSGSGSSSNLGSGSSSSSSDNLGSSSSSSSLLSSWKRLVAPFMNGRNSVVQQQQPPPLAAAKAVLLAAHKQQQQQQQQQQQLPPLAAAKAAFLAEHGQQYGYHGWLDAHWQQEVGVRLPGGQHYLDFTGASLYANSQIAAAAEMLSHHAFGNPHSRNPSSHRSAAEQAAAASQVLAWLGAADPQEYVLVWTRGATEALKMVGEWFPWSPQPHWQPSRGTPAGGVTNRTVGHVSKCGTQLHFRQLDKDSSSHFVYTRANHKSVLGIGAYAQDKGALLSCVDEAQMDSWLAEPPQRSHVQPPKNSSSSSSNGGGRGGSSSSSNGSTTYSLVAFPAKDNYEGVLYPLDWVGKIHAKSTQHHRWLVMLDAAAYVPTHALNLSRTPADFVSLSFYKVFGYPAGLGALIARKESAAILHKVYFGGGSVDDATAQDVWRMLSEPPNGFQDGTVDFLGIAELQFGFDLLLNKLGGMQAIHGHVLSLQGWAYSQLSSLRHSNSQPLLEIFGRHATPIRQSCLFQFLVHRRNSSVVPAEEVEVVAAAAGIHLRTGCHCNPGQCLLDLGIEPQEERAAALAHNASRGFITVLRRKQGSKLEPVQLPIGSVRASLGALSTFEDVYALVKFLQDTYVDKDPPEVLYKQGQAAGGGAGSWYSNLTVQEHWNAECGA